MAVVARPLVNGGIVGDDAVEFLKEKMDGTVFSSRAKRVSREGKVQPVKEKTAELYLDVFDVPVVDEDESGRPLVSFADCKLEVGLTVKGPYISAEVGNRRFREPLEADEKAIDAIQDVVNGKDLIVDYKINPFRIGKISSKNGAVELSNYSTWYSDGLVERFSETPLTYDTFLDIIMKNDEDGNRILESQSTDIDGITIGTVLGYIDRLDKDPFLGKKSAIRAIKNRLYLFFHINGLCCVPEIASRSYYRLAEVGFLIGLPHPDTKAEMKRNGHQVHDYGCDKGDVYSYLATRGRLPDRFVQMQDEWRALGCLI